MADIRVLVVDDCEATRRLLVHMIGKQDGMTVVGEAVDGVSALLEIEKQRPDVVTLDLQMPQMDGLTTLQNIRERFGRLPVVVCSSLTAEGARTTVDALLAGADDFMCKIPPLEKNTNRVRHLQDELGGKIRAVYRGQSRPAVPRPTVAAPRTVDVVSQALRTEEPKRSVATSRNRGQKYEILVIGASTGGPAALAELMSQLPVDLPVPVCIVQHMPASFTPLLAQTLSRRVHRRIVEAKQGMTMEAGCYYVAPGDQHLVVERNDGLFGRLALHNGPALNGCRPAVDELFRSAGKEYGPACLGVVLTGMGSDGLVGSRVIHEHGGIILVQDRESSVVWGMPRHVAEAGLAKAALPLGELATEIQIRLAQTPSPFMAKA